MDYEKLSKVAATESSVVPCCVQHADTKEVLIIAYAARHNVPLPPTFLYAANQSP